MYISLNGVLGTENCYVIYLTDELTFKIHNKVVIKNLRYLVNAIQH